MDDRTRTDTPAPAPSVETQKKRLKKQAKREARAMHALDQARRDLQKTERKLARTQQELQQRLIDVEICAAKLGKIRARQTFAEIAATPPSEQSIILQIIETKEVEIPESMQEFAVQVENLEQLSGADETLALNLNENNEFALEVHEREPGGATSGEGNAASSGEEPDNESSEGATGEENPAPSEKLASVEHTPDPVPDPENVTSQEIADLEKALEEDVQASSTTEPGPTETMASTTESDSSETAASATESDSSETTVKRPHSSLLYNELNDTDTPPY